MLMLLTWNKGQFDDFLACLFKCSLFNIVVHGSLIFFVYGSWICIFFLNTFGKWSIVYYHWSRAWYIYDTRAHILLSGYLLVADRPSYSPNTLTRVLKICHRVTCWCCRWVCEEIPDLKLPMDKYVLNGYDTKRYSSTHSTYTFSILRTQFTKLDMQSFSISVPLPSNCFSISDRYQAFN